MNKKIFLTSAIIFGVACCPAMAEPSNTSPTFPDASNNEYMQEDYTYTGAATSTNMAGVYADGATVYANARYHDATYTLAAGKYLPANSETPIDCDQNGYFCAGDNNGVNYSSSAQGLTQCPSGYANTANGASANTDCYRTCTNADVAHSTGTVNGEYYYGDNNQCEPTNCVNGWHVKPGLNLTTAIGTSAGVCHAYKTSIGIFNEDCFGSQEDKGQSYYGITENNTWVVDYGSTKGMVFGTSRCSTVEGISNGSDRTIHTTAELGTEGGKNCYCNVTGYKDASGYMQNLSSSWVFFSDYIGPGYCSDSCANHCSYSVLQDSEYYLAIRAAVFGAVEPILASCAANTINITWDGATSASVSANNAGSVTYGGDIRTPQSAIHVPGKVFDGWEFSTTASQNPVTE